MSRQLDYMAEGAERRNDEIGELMVGPSSADGPLSVKRPSRSGSLHGEVPGPSRLVSRGRSGGRSCQANRLKTATVSGVTETSTYDGDGLRFSRQVGAGPVIRAVTDPTAGLPVTIDDGSRKYDWGQGLACAVLRPD